MLSVLSSRNLGLILDIVHKECGYQVIIGRPRDLHLPPKHGESPLPADPWLQCTDVAGAWWLNLIVTYASLGISLILVFM